MNAIVPRATVEQIVAYRNKALQLYEIAYDKIEEAHEAVKAAHEMASRAHPGVNNFNYSQAEEIKAFHRAVAPPERGQYLRTARRLTDIDAWAWIIERSELERLMDAEEKKKLRDQMAFIPERVDPRTNQLINEEEIARGLPELTVENVIATIEQFAGQADMIFRRGIANVFSQLDRRFRSHDGFKIGSRIILTYVFNDSGHLTYGRTRDVLIDVERVFSVLDGKPEAPFTSALYAIEADRRGTWGRRQSEVETEYFKIRGFKNGNAHLWFQRDDLVRKVNRLLGEYYGEAIGDGQQRAEDPFENIKYTPAKRYGFFPTPDAAATEAIGLLPLHRKIDEPDLRVLEPSAGTGNLARLAAQEISSYDGYGKDRRDYVYRARVDCIEIQPNLAESLRAEGIYRTVYNQDFHTLSPETTGLYDRIIMNPPFDRERDIDHVMHALKFLREDGCLVAIMSAGTEFRETKKSVAFRALMEKMGAKWRDLPAGSFSSVGTNVNTVVVRVWKDGRTQSWW